ncbi:MAG: hypothetical protein AB7N61_20825 [Acidimicrobiia bacterium]
MDAALVAETMDQIFYFVEQDLDERQDAVGAGEDQRIAVQRVSAGNEPSVGTASKRRAQILLLAVGVVVSLGIVVAFDGFLAFRRRGLSEPPVSPDLDGSESALPSPAAHAVSARTSYASAELGRVPESSVADDIASTRPTSLGTSKRTRVRRSLVPTIGPAAPQAPTEEQPNR